MRRNNKGFIATAVLYSLVALISMVLFIVLRNAKTTRDVARDTVEQIKNQLVYYEVVYNGNGSTSGSMENTRIYLGEEGQLAKNLYERDGYKFLGWSTSANGEVVYKDEQVLKPTSSPNIKIDLFAIWKRNRFWLQIDPNGGNWNGSTSISKYEKYENTIDAIVPPVREGYDFLGWEHTGEGILRNYGTSLYTDESFANGTNYMTAYNNTGNGKVVVDRIARSNDSPIKNSNYMMRITTSGDAQPGLGGFYQATYSKLLGVSYHVVVAKIPKGYSLSYHSNAIGENSKMKWITSNEGTGSFQTYIYRIESGTKGTFSTYGFLALNGEKATASKPVVWYVAYSAIIDQTAGTSLYNDPGFSTSTNNMQLLNRSNNGNTSLTKVSRTSDSLLTSNYMMRLRNIGNAQPGLGGFSQLTTSREKGVYYHMMYAKLPEGYTIETTHDGIGNGGKIDWVRTNKGTGNFERYIYRAEGGGSGTFSTFGHVYLNGVVGTSSNAVIWDVGYANIYDSSSLAGKYSGYAYEFQESDGSLKAKWELKTYMITFNLNGGSGTFNPLKKIHGTNIILPTGIPTKNTYKFLGWSENPNATSATYKAGTTFALNKDTTLYAVWQKIYTITYNANGGSGGPTTQSKLHNEAINLSSTKPTRTNYNFLGWSTNKSATSATYKAGARFTLNQDTTLYAVWERAIYTITYDANGGSGAPASQTKTHGVALTLSSTKPTRTNYAFLGWSTNKNATSASFKPGSSFSTNADTTLYAVWGPGSMTVHLDYRMTNYGSNPDGDSRNPHVENFSDRTRLSNNSDCGRGWGHYLIWAVSTTNLDVSGYNYLKIKVRVDGIEDKNKQQITVGGRSAQLERTSQEVRETNDNTYLVLDISGLEGSYSVELHADASTNWNYDVCIGVNVDFYDIILSMEP